MPKSAAARALPVATLVQRDDRITGFIKVLGQGVVARGMFRHAMADQHQGLGAAILW